VPRVFGNEVRAEREEADVRTTAIRSTAAAVLLTATVLGLAGCVNAEKSAPPGAGNSVSYGPAVTTTQSAPASPSVGASTNPSTSQGATTAAQTADRHDQADVTFAKQALLLRQQAVSMAGAAGSGSVSSQVKALAAKIDGDPVATDTLSGWLTGWHQTVPTPATATVPGVLSTAQLHQVTGAQGTSFDMQWLQFMKANLASATQVVATEQAHGTNTQARQLARRWASLLKSETTTIDAIG
jgi:uncharacterized protein (DUF305 family)